MKWGIIGWLGIVAAGFGGAFLVYGFSFLAPRWQEVILTKEATGAAIGAVLTIVGAQIISKRNEWNDARRRRRSFDGLVAAVDLALTDFLAATDENIFERSNSAISALDEAQMLTYYLTSENADSRIALKTYERSSTRLRTDLYRLAGNRHLADLHQMKPLAEETAEQLQALKNLN